MGYRFVIRKFAFPTEVKQQGQFSITSWWENKGVAPIYKDYIFSIRLKSENMIEILDTSANIRAWLPGDIVFDEKLYIPYDLAEGDYEVEIAIVDPVAHVPRVKLAIEGVNKDGWYPMGKIKVKN
jgi:hypothetical protein